MRKIINLSYDYVLRLLLDIKLFLFWSKLSTMQKCVLVLVVCDLILVYYLVN